MSIHPATPAAPGKLPDTQASHEGHEGQEGQQHPLGLYLKVWLLLFVLSTLSYMVDYFHVSGPLRWTLILVFMALKAGLIISVFMHMAWERMALMWAILLPPLCLLVLVWLMAAEADYTFLLRGEFFR
ncbi:cytochrome C oxidase subunit IV family protein [Cupriavidus agavae]|uniref:Cytochrome c oxidase subunit IV n=1 Tax=Cupriavidus agavae TaxID=1001822 RepID=A0A4Q7RV13_9BURK|nr:cytochrome C oxidase subunit IV family protein [Cupriavidus agavae]RZT36282.1 cytochrome c oxidase subunit IV [Cupriavidus agavae]